MVHDYNLSSPIDAHQMQQLLDRMKTNASLFDQYIRYDRCLGRVSPPPGSTTITTNTPTNSTKTTIHTPTNSTTTIHTSGISTTTNTSSSSTITTAYVIMSMLFITIVLCFIIV